MSDEIILFDLPSRGKPTSWSLNPWKARLVLNYKGLPYRTEWVEYPDVAPTFKSFGIPPNDPDVNPNFDYSIPAIKLADGRYLMDSLAIAHELEKLHPEPSLHLNNDYAKRAQTAVANVLTALAAIAMPRVPEMLLNPASQEYFNTTREKRFGMPLTELAKSDKAGETGWKEAEPGLQQIKELLAENKDGPYVQGQQPSFADFILAGLWRFYERLDKNGDLFGRTMKYDESFKRHYEACEKWLEKDA